MRRKTTLITLLGLWREQWLLLAPALILSAALGGVVSNTVYGWMLGGVLEGVRSGDGARVFPRILAYAAALCLIGAGAALCRYVTDVMMEKGRLKLQSRAFGHILSFPLSEFVHTHQGEYNTLLSIDTEQTIQAMSRMLALLSSLLFSNLASIVTIFALSPAMGWVVLGVALLSLTFNGAFAPYLRRLNATQKRNTAELTVKLSDLLSGYLLVLTDDQQGYFLKKCLDTVEKHFEMGWKIKKTSAVASTPAELSRFLIDGIILGAGAWLLARGSLSTDAMMICWTQGVGIGFAMRRLAKDFLSMQENLASAQRVCALLDKHGGEGRRQDAALPENTRLEVDGVGFTYEDRPVLQDVSCSFAAGEFVAVVGSTGCGKTTLANLIAGFCEPDRGSIRIGGVDVRQLPVRALRQLIVYMPQNAGLFSGSIRENLTLGHAGATDEQLWAAVERAQLGETLRMLTHGMDTQVGEEGSQLSGGQKQRVALARAFLAEAPILILDEPTSNLDEQSAQRIIEALTGMRSKTRIVITHDEVLARAADRVIAMKSGRIA